jgi:SAM-dependent methyltransferase
MAMSTDASPPWWADFFDDTYADIGLTSASEQAEQRLEAAVAFIARVLELEPGDLVFDQCCGIGRLSLPLAAAGFRVIGVDQAATYTQRAQALADEAGLQCRFVAGDAFELVAPEPCAGAFNWFTSFGYHADDAVNRRMLDRAFESLVPGGRFALEYMSVPRILRDFRACHLDRVQSGGRELWLIQEPRFDFAAGMIRCDWTFMRPDESHEVRRVENRAYMPAEILSLLGAAGFEDLSLYGSIEGEPFDLESPRCIAVGRKPST